MDPDALSHLIIIFLASFQACSGFGFHHYRILQNQHKSHGHISGPALSFNHRFPPWKPHRYWGKRKRSGNIFLTPEKYRKSKRFLHYSPYIFEYFPVSKASRATKSRKLGLTSVRSPLESIVKKPFILQALDALPSLYEAYPESISPFDIASTYGETDRQMPKESVQISEMSEKLRPDPPLYEKKPEKVDPISVVPPFPKELDIIMQGKIKNRNRFGVSGAIDDGYEYEDKKQSIGSGSEDVLGDKMDITGDDQFFNGNTPSLRQSLEEPSFSKDSFPILDLERDKPHSDYDQPDVFELPFTRSDQSSFPKNDDVYKDSTDDDTNEFIYSLFHPKSSFETSHDQGSFLNYREDFDTKDVTDRPPIAPAFSFEGEKSETKDKDKGMSLQEKLDIINDPNWDGTFGDWSAPKIDLTRTNIQPGQTYPYHIPIGFHNDMGGCQDIEIRTCSTDSDCSNCLGLFFCISNKCSKIPSVPQSPPDSGFQDMGSWGEKPFSIDELSQQ